jgi:YD repeat-containing protein
MCYEAQGRLTIRTQGTRTTTIGYDGQGYLASVTDPLARTVSFTNDGVGRATAQHFPDARVRFVVYASTNAVEKRPDYDPWAS